MDLDRANEKNETVWELEYDSMVREREGSVAVDWEREREGLLGGE